MTYQLFNMGSPDLKREINLALAMADDSPNQWWWLSFTDPDIAATIPEEERVPGGPSWLGGCYVDAPNEIMAIRRAHELGCNPGGEVAIHGPLPAEEFEQRVPASKRCRLLSLSEID